MVEIVQIALDFLESEILMNLGWALVAGIIEEAEGSDSEYRVRSERDC